MTRYICALLIVLSASAAGCTTRGAIKPDPRDPFERVNRATFAFNDAVDRAVLKPVAKGYRKVAPQFVETGISNFMSNIHYPVVIVNNLLQAKFKPALSDTGRLLLNTTFGLAGFLDPASAAGLDRNDEDFGQTLGKWGAGAGPYLILPFLGPYTLRDGVGTAVDQFADPRTYIERDSIRMTIQAVRIIDMRARLLDVEGTLNKAYDRYAFLRNVYLQRREYQVTDGQVTDGEVAEEPMEDPIADEPIDDEKGPDDIESGADPQ
jgi:phospholipid-binding lipoprotein MlaA